MVPHQDFVADAVVMTAGPAGGPPQAVNIDIKGEPRVQERTRFSRRGGISRLYDPSSALKTQFRDAVRDSLTDLGISGFPLYGGQGDDTTIQITVVFPITNMAKDIDNLLKFVLDTLQTVIYANDRLVMKVVAEKRHFPQGQGGYTTIRVVPSP